MAFGSAFQANAFQKNAFQVGIAAQQDYGAAESTGIGAVIDTTGWTDPAIAVRKRQDEWESDLRRIVDEAFDGKPPQPVEDAIEEYAAGMEPVADTQWIYDLLDAALMRRDIETRTAIKVRNDREALEILLMVA